MGKGRAIDCNFLNLSLIVSLCLGVLVLCFGLFLVFRLAYEDSTIETAHTGTLILGLAVLNDEKIQALKDANKKAASQNKPQKELALPTSWYILSILIALAGLVQTAICAVSLKIKLNQNIIIGVHIVPIVLLAMAILTYVAQEWVLPIFPGWFISLSIIDILVIVAGIILKLFLFKK